MDDALNSNTENIFDDIYQDIDEIYNMGHGVKVPVTSTTGRKVYAALDIGSMGVDVNTGPFSVTDSLNHVDNRLVY